MPLTNEHIPTLNPNRTLAHFYKAQTSLRRFLPSLFPPALDLVLFSPGDPQTLLDLLDHTLVCLEPTYSVRRVWDVVEPFQGTMSELLNRAIVQIFKASKTGKPSNQLANGFTASSYGYSMVTNANSAWNDQRPGIYSKHLNTNNSVFAQPAWSLLVERIGPGPFHHLLTSTSLFLPLPNECFSQLTGTSMIDLPPFVASLPQPSHPKRKRRDEDQEYWGPPALRKKKRTKPREPVKAEEEEEDAEMLDADVEMELSMGEIQPVEEQPRVMKMPKSRRELVKKRTPADIAFARNRIFYSRSLKKAGRSEPEKRIIVGLPPNHILYLLHHPTPKPTGPTSDPIPVALSRSDALVLLKYIFPLQFGLHNVFTSSLPEPGAPKSANVLQDYTSRKEEIEMQKARGTQSGPGGGKRMKGSTRTRELVEELWRRHGECDYWKLRAIYCPSKVVLNTSKAPKTSDNTAASLKEIGFGAANVSIVSVVADTTLPLEFISQPPVASSQALHPGDNSSVSLDPQSQNPFASLDVSHSSLVLPHGAENGDLEERKKKQKFKNFTQSSGQVCRFATSVIKKVIPMGFFGSESNRKLILRQVETFITLRRFESLSLHSVLQGFSLAECTWLESDNFKQGDRVSAPDSAKRTEILHEFIYWIFDSFLIPLLKTTFYITESAAFKKQVLFFRQDDWDTICKPLFAQLQTSAYEQISKADSLRTLSLPRQLGHSYIRLLPKENGVRPLSNLKRPPKTKNGQPMKDAKGAFVKSINATLKETFSILVERKESDPSLFGASILGADDIYSKLKKFKKRTMEGVTTGGKPPPYYFVKVDVRSCFDTIDQTKLMEILEEILEADDDFSVIRFNKAKLSGGLVRKKFLQRAFPAVDSPTFPELADIVARKHHGEILMDKAFEISQDKEETLRLLREHVTDNLIKIGPNFFRQAKGIPQGSVVSTHLCSFFYADMERRYLGFTAGEDCMLVRLVDDFLLITTNKDKAVEFVRTMHRGHPNYGCFVSREKTLINFECRLEDEDNPLVTSSTDFPWCGRFIDTQLLHVKGDYLRDATHIKNTLTINTLRHPGLTIRAKIFRNLAQKSSICFNDTTLNTPHVVHLNIYQNVLFCAMKTVWYLKELARARGGGGRELRENGFLLATIHEAGDFTYNTVRNGARSSDAVEHGGEVRVRRDDVMWLTTHAFLTVFATKPTLFRSLILSLRLIVEKEPDQAEGWKEVTEKGWRGMRGVRF